MLEKRDQRRHVGDVGADLYVVDAEGYQAVIVNGQVLLEQGKPTGALPGQLLRPPT